MKHFNTVAKTNQKVECHTMTVKNYGATDIADGSALIIDTTNNDTTQGMMAVTTTASADSVSVVGAAKGIIPADGVGEMVPCGCGGITEVIVVVGTAYAQGDLLSTSTTAGAFYKQSTLSAATLPAIAGKVIGATYANTVTKVLAQMGL